MDLLRISIDPNWNIQVFANKWLLLAVLFPAVLLLLRILHAKYWGRPAWRSFEIDEAEIGIGNQRIKIKPNCDDRQIAYKLWVELSTRKIGLPIDFENDVIPEIYASWYSFFKLTRDLIKDIPVSRLAKSQSTRQLVTIAIDVLNEGLRPHLTRWQARFRQWYQAESKKDQATGLAPQELQKRFPDYDQLTQNMKEVNQRLINYRETLRKIAIDSR
jgi:hypothetical protein